MPSTQLETQIRNCIDSFVEELSTLVKQAAIESVQDALGGSAASTSGRKTGRAGTSTKGRRGKRVRRSAGDVEATATAVLSYVRANPGEGVIEIGRALGLTPKQLRLPVKKLLEDGKMKTTGQRRGTKYHVGAGRKKSTRTAAKKPAKKRGAKKRRKTKSGKRAA